jgi:hypothetical protein
MDLDAENQRIWRLFGALSDAFWLRISQHPGISVVDALRAQADGPVGAEEEAAWEELTSPHNYSSLVRYIEMWKKLGANEDNTKLYYNVLERARTRWEAAQRNAADESRECR